MAFLSVSLAGCLIAPAAAADLGGSCCADLEERIAELEATAARKGNHKLSLNFSGWVHQAMFMWDDGVERNTYVGTNTIEMTRFRFAGDAKIDDGWSAGYMIEVGFRPNPSSGFEQDAGSTAASQKLLARRVNWFFKSKTLGRFLVGLEGTPTYHLTGDPSGPVATRFYDDSEAFGSYQGRFLLRSGGELVDTGIRWSDILGGTNSASPGQIGRHNIIRYDTPEIMGFVANVSWGEDDMWGTSLAYTFTNADFKVMAKVGYEHNTSSHVEVCNKTAADLDCEWWGAGMTIHHLPTGLFVYGAYGEQSDKSEETVDARAEGNDAMWIAQGGIEKKFFGLGKTTVYGEYRHDDPGSNLSKTFNGSFVHHSDIDFWGVGMVQNIEPAAMDLYALYHHADGDVTNQAGDTLKLDALDLVIAGARINF